MGTAPKVGLETAPLMVRVFDGARQLVKEGVEILYRVIDGNQKERISQFIRKPVLRADLPFADNLADRYTVIVSADGRLQSGFMPVQVQPGVLTMVDLMLLPRNNAFNFHAARWQTLKKSHPKLAALFSAGLKDADARDRYTQLMEQSPANLATFFNITSAMDGVLLPSGRALDYVKGFTEEDCAKCLLPDRFFAYADGQLIDQVRQAVLQGAFQQQPLPGLFHPGATISFKQVQFGEANVQLTFHEGDSRDVGGAACVKLEPDMDYFRDPLAHSLLEVLPNRFGGSTDPRQIYVLRWMAGRRAGVPEFEPPYTIEEA